MKRICDLLLLLYFIGALRRNVHQSQQKRLDTRSWKRNLLMDVAQSTSLFQRTVSHLTVHTGHQDAGTTKTSYLMPWISAVSPTSVSATQQSAHNSVAHHVHMAASEWSLIQMFAALSENVSDLLVMEPMLAPTISFHCQEAPSFQNSTSVETERARLVYNTRYFSVFNAQNMIFLTYRNPLIFDKLPLLNLDVKQAW